MSDPGHPSPRYRALIQLLRTAEDLWNASRVFFARWDLSPSQFNVLNVLADHPLGLSQSELSRLLIMHRSNATGLVDRLERRNLVRREANPDDRRAYCVVLTPAGTDLLREIHPHYFAAAERVWSDVPEARAHELLDQLHALAATASTVAAHGAAQGSPEAANGESRMANVATEFNGGKHRRTNRGATLEPVARMEGDALSSPASAAPRDRRPPTGFMGGEHGNVTRARSSERELEPEREPELRTSDL